MIPRYTLPEMEKVWAEEEKFKIWLNIELLVCEAWAKLGKIPPEEVKKIRKKAGFDIEKVKKIEEEVKHDVIAFLMDLSQKVGSSSRYIHLGLTSSDLLDTTFAIQLKRASEIIIKDLERLLKILKEKAIKYKYTVMMGRTHGVHAEPITLGLKFALWYEEIKRSLERVKRATDEISYGKISGAVGTYAHLDPRIEEEVCDRLGLKPCPVSNQIVQRDRHCFYLSSLAILASSLEKFCVEIRGLHRTEIRELEEGFGRKQRGSSAMPHKKNPIICERICGLARVVRSNLQAALENIALWGERDISHSSCERIIFKNLEISRGVFFSQRLMLKLVEKGLPRDEAYRLVQKNAMRCWEEGKDFRKLVTEDANIASHLSRKEIEELFELNYYIRYVDKIMERLRIG